MILNLLLVSTLMASQTEDHTQVHIEVNLHQLSPQGRQALQRFCNNNAIDHRCDHIDDKLTVVKGYHIDHSDELHTECHTVSEFLNASEVDELVQRRYRETNEAGTVHIVFEGE